MAGYNGPPIAYVKNIFQEANKPFEVLLEFQNLLSGQAHPVSRVQGILAMEVAPFGDE